MMNGDYVPRHEHQELKERVDYTEGRVMAHDSTLKVMSRDLANIRTELHELNNWKDDSKVQEIALLKGRIKKSERTKDRIMYALLVGGALEVIRLILERWMPTLHP